MQPATKYSTWSQTLNWLVTDPRPQAVACCRLAEKSEKHTLINSVVKLAEALSRDRRALYGGPTANVVADLCWLYMIDRPSACCEALDDGDVENFKVLYRELHPSPPPLPGTNGAPTHSADETFHVNFRADVRIKVLIWSGGVLIDSGSLLAAAPNEPDALDEAIAMVVGDCKLPGTLFLTFCLRYFGNESDPADNDRMRKVYDVHQHRYQRDNISSFEPIEKNSEQALEVLSRVIKHPTTGEQYRKGILEAWEKCIRKLSKM